jgi:Flp pilus assembly CpaE family ATPase
MLKAIIAGETPELVARLKSMCGALDIIVQKAIDLQGPSETLVRLVASYRADILFLELSAGTLPASLELAKRLHANRSDAIFVGFATEPIAEERTALEAGIWQILVSPFDEQDFLQIIRLALDQQKSEPSVHGFLPAKGGSGATVTALNTATCLAQVLHRKVLLIEADFDSGILPLLLNIKPQSSVMEALECSDVLDDRSWPAMVTNTHGVDILAAWGARTAGQESPLSFDRLLSFAKKRYDTVLVDLPVIVDRMTEAVSYHSTNMFVVATPESICIDVARRRLRQLEARGAKSSSRRVILNRVLEHPTNVDVAEYERAIGAKIAAVLPNDYSVIQQSIAGTGPVNLESLLGKAYLALAGSIAGQEMPLEPPNPEKFASLKNLFSLMTRTDPVKAV